MAVATGVAPLMSVGLCGFARGEQGSSAASSRSPAAAKLRSSSAFLVGPGTRAGAFSKAIVGKRMCKALGLFEGPTDPPQRWPIHSRLPGNNNREK